jgi:hypothetical protein
LNHNNLANFYRLNFALWKHHGMAIDLAEELIPYEIDFYVSMLKEWMEKQSQQARQLGYKANG